MSVDYAKLKTNLNLIMHRLKLVEKKKMELNQKARRTIGEFLNAGKVDRARIRVEQIIREDYIVEAMDLVESYCDFLISRFGQLKSTETVDEGLATAISSLIWVTPFFENDVPELKTISDQLGKKYGKQYVTAVQENSLKTVNETLMKKMSVQVPPKVLVEKYLVEIAKDQKIDYKPDPRVMKENEALNSTNFGQGASSDDDDHHHHHGGAGNGSGGQRDRQPGQAAPEGGFNLINLGDHYPMNPITQPSFNPYGQPPPLPSEPPLGTAQPVGPADLMTDSVDASAPSARMPIGFNMSNSGLDMTDSSNEQSNRLSSDHEKASTTKPLQKGNTTGDNANQSGGAGSSSHPDGGPPPNYDSVVNKPANQTQYYSFGPDSSLAPHHRPKDDLNDTLPELPPVPKDVNESGHSKSDTEDFEDLTRRFEELKNRKN